MDINEKINLLAEAMDVLPEELHEDDDLTTNENWDSLSKLAFLSLLQSKCSKRITPKDMSAVVKVSDALKLMEP
ncbi:hypothetical protein SAMN05216582_1228 [Selenomonas ruminantium]|uniref:Carrier domain-containing protein n=1 Tax=Selenomonas ruminantium TaxID=971 RepID=A0A1M6W281_SELRU|nr:hypothetical protein [Selenomonas ruminantium]SHK87787.1 hypothetical protein SAMN05216582_1228 [Selenomonas ruminantium]